MTTAPMVETTFTVGRHFTVAMSLPLPTPGGGLDAVLDVRWSPRMPGRRPNKKELADYRRGRDAALSEVARWIGKRVIVIER